MKVVLADYGAGNLRSVCSAFRRAGATPVVSANPREALDAPLTVIAGVGNSASAARGLEERGLADALRARAAAGKPLLGICVGLQLFFEHSEEDPDARGLGIVDGEVRRLKAAKVPLIGWATLDVAPRAKVLDAVQPDDMAYFVHSYYVDPEPGVVAATTTYEHDFCSAIEADNVVGVQFHPEKSAEVGRKVLQRFFDVVVPR